MLYLENVWYFFDEALRVMQSGGCGTLKARLCIEGNRNRIKRIPLNENGQVINARKNARI